ncbi:MAG: class I SAM-dependent methyltransferase [Alphaproteobacteria bacterium]|jgi:SAM-dependent methyltransferase|nr:class I SAM-dependent methyltransferase [Rhodospirillaceae bacterium]MBT6510426.1 class I SAM-dependent methyltransferase [Rhodospirillaceae bacterium]MBT7614811.1 class I SAM-dependent methyltransferase [Rhodospirillaceae bacterium]MDG2479536.1 class I SAM-dependent methyltransferase [Alphaproteobacteria bacterium]
MSEKHSWDAAGYQKNAGFVPVLGKPVLDLLSPVAGERVLDLGCGHGTLTKEIVAAGCDVVGIDQSQEMVTAASEQGLDAHVMDATTLTFQNEFDAVFSNAVLHWVKGANAAISGVARALKPGGRFVGEFGGHGNMAAVVTALAAVLDKREVDIETVNPWFYPTPDNYRSRLEAAGFTVDSIALITRPTPLPTGMAGWLGTFAGLFFAALPEADRLAARDETIDLLRHSLCDDQGNWTADYVRLRFSAHLHTAA